MRRGTQENRVPATSLTTVKPFPVAMAGRSDLVKYPMMKALVVVTREHTIDPDALATYSVLRAARSRRRSGFELTQFGVDGTVGASVVATEAANPIHLLGTLQARAQNAFRYRS